MPPDVRLTQGQNAPNSISGRALPQTLSGELTARRSPRRLAV